MTALILASASLSIGCTEDSFVLQVEVRNVAERIRVTADEELVMPTLEDGEQQIFMYRYAAAPCAADGMNWESLTYFVNIAIEQDSYVAQPGGFECVNGPYSVRGGI